jgi:hypothetical protein
MEQVLSIQPVSHLALRLLEHSSLLFLLSPDREVSGQACVSLCVVTCTVDGAPLWLHRKFSELRPKPPPYAPPLVRSVFFVSPFLLT